MHGHRRSWGEFRLNTLQTACDTLAAAPACWVEVLRTQGSVPRAAGTWMLVSAEGLVGTIGGGHLEFQAMDQARALLAAAEPPVLEQRYALGPSLGQCCGGVVWLRFEPLARGDLARLRALAEGCRDRLAPPLQVALFGAGHVGHALVRLLATLPCRLLWVDSRDAVFAPQWLEAMDVVCEHSDPVQGAVADLAPGSQVLIMSFSHAEDLEVVAACLQRQRQRGDLDFIGLIGSATKWAVFRRRLEQRGFSAEELDQVTCPIGLPGITGKEPEVIAVAVAAQLLQRQAGEKKPPQAEAGS